MDGTKLCSVAMEVWLRDGITFSGIVLALIGLFKLRLKKVEEEMKKENLTSARRTPVMHLGAWLR